jgi:hypothetical protein
MPREESGLETLVREHKDRKEVAAELRALTLEAEELAGRMRALAAKLWANGVAKGDGE